jgi:LPS sulfotransferase NodH
MELSSRTHERLLSLRAYVEGARTNTSNQTRFFIITSGRSGSELLVTLLNSHPQIACDGEFLMDRRRWPERFIEGRAAVAAHRGKQAYGLKMLPQHIYDVQALSDPAEWPRHLVKEGWQVIRLRRANRLHQAISMVRAAKTNWHYRAPEAGPFKPIEVDVMQLIASLYVIEWLEHQIDELVEGLDCIELCYEDDLETEASQARTIERICQELNLAPSPTSSDLIRINPRHARDMITNYDEVVAELRRNRFLDGLED